MLFAYMNPSGSAVKMLLFHHIQESSAVISDKFFQLGCGFGKRLVGLGRFELDHPALQCSFFFFSCFAFLFYFDFQGSATFTWWTVLDIWFRYTYL